MKNSIAIVIFMSVTFVASVYGDNWYVNANKGNDSWDGTTPEIPTQEQIEAGGTVAGPRKTLHAMMSDERVVAGDTLWAAEGDYNEGGAAYTTYRTVNRVQVKAGVALRASGRRNETFITGSGGTFVSGAYSNGAVRCVYFLKPPENAQYAQGIVKGFTLRSGRTCAKENDKEEFGGGSTGNGLLVECDFINNGCANSSRGGTMNQGCALRCNFISTDRGYHAYLSTKMVDSLISCAGVFYNGCKAYNCTFTGNAYLRDGDSFNCLFIGNGTASAYQNNGTSKTYHLDSLSRFQFNSDTCVKRGTSRVVTPAETPYDAATLRPLAGSAAIDAANRSNYVDATNGWSSAWCSECGTDYYGGERVVNGLIDVGCGEAQDKLVLTVADMSDGLEIEGAELGNTEIAGENPYKIVFSRNFNSDQLCIGVEVNGVFHSFGGTTNDVPYELTIDPRKFGDYSIAAVYETDQKDWYVSPEGNDKNKGYHIKRPRKTLDKAMELAKENSGHIVHAAAGTYDEFSEGYTGASRVTVKEGVGLVADEWPFKETVIMGAKDTSGEADKNGNGPNAVRCAYVNGGGYVRGFKLTGGRTKKGEASSAQGGAAYLNGGALIDCEITGVGCAYRGRATASNSIGTLIRCHLHDMVCGSYDVYFGNVIDSYISGTENDTLYYGASTILNSTVRGIVRSQKSLLAVNSFIAKGSVAPSASFFCTNCVFDSSRSSADSAQLSFDPKTCLFSVSAEDNLDDDMRPGSYRSPLVDAGSLELYNKYFPSKWAKFKNADFAGGQRVYNGRIDVGCGEYDFRSDFSRILGVRGAVAEMGSFVTVNSVPEVVIPEGEKIVLSLSPRTPGRTSRYELVHTPAGGSKTVIVETTSEAFVLSLDGPCSVQSLKRCSGTAVYVR